MLKIKIKKKRKKLDLKVCTILTSGLPVNRSFLQILRRQNVKNFTFGGNFLQIELKKKFCV